MMPWSPAPSSFFSVESTPDGDVGGLGVQQNLDAGRAPVEAFLLVADIPDGEARHVRDEVVRDDAGAAILAGDDEPVRRRQGLAGDPDLPGVEPSFAASRKNRSTTSSETRSQTLSG